MINGSISTPMAWVLWIPATGAISPITVDRKKMNSPNHPVNASVIEIRPAKTTMQSSL
jgi:hypothetical protein